MSIFDIFKPSPYIQEIKDEKIVRKKYRYWRIRIFYSMYLGYALFYLSRKSYNFAMPFIIHDLGFTKTQVGIVGSMLTMTYGFSKFITGIMSDKSNPRYFMAIGLIFTGVFNILFGFSSSLIFFIIFAGFNGWFPQRKKESAITGYNVAHITAVNKGSYLIGNGLRKF